MTLYRVDLGNSDTEELGATFRVEAPTPERVIEILQEAFHELELDAFGVIEVDLLPVPADAAGYKQATIKQASLWINIQLLSQAQVTESD